MYRNGTSYTSPNSLFPASTSFKLLPKSTVLTMAPLSKHRSQWLDSPSLHGFSPILHVSPHLIPSTVPSETYVISQLLGLSSFVYSYKWLHDNPTPINDSYGWHFQYLTIIGLTLATLTFSAGIISDFSSSTRLFRIKNYLSMCTTPLEVLISVLYWTLRTYDKNLVIPEWAQLPLPADVSFHAVPSIVLTLDLLLLSPPWTISAPQAMGLSTVLAFSYWFWVEECHRHNGFYPYPIFEEVGFGGRIVLHVVSALVMTGSTVVLKRLYRVVNGDGGKSTTAMDESSLSEAVRAYAKEARWIAEGQE